MINTIHVDHCEFCVSIGSCELLGSSNEICPIVKCLNPECSLLMHECKLTDHITICLFSQVPCINAQYGCELLLSNFERGNHLKTCVASTVVCRATFFRQVLRNSNLDDEGFIKSLNNETLRQPDGQQGCLDLYTGLFAHHLNLTANSSSNSRTSKASQHAESDDSNLDRQAERTNLTLTNDQLNKRCVTCVKLGIVCMYDLERQNRKPFWIEARSHFGSRSGNQSDDRLISPDLFDGARVYFDGLSHSGSCGSHFACNRTVRRDEFSFHYMFLHNLLFEFQPHRCPLWRKGCTFSLPRMNEVNGLGVHFCPISRGPTVRLSTISGSEDKTTISHGQRNQWLKLPQHLLMEVLKSLDSLSLKYLSQTCRDWRWRVLEFAESRSRGIVNTYWLPCKTYADGGMGNNNNNNVKEESISWIFSYQSVSENNCGDQYSSPEFTFSDECFLPTTDNLQYDLNSNIFDSYQMCNSVSLVNGQISRFCNYTGHENLGKMSAHLQRCAHNEDQQGFKEHHSYDMEGRIPLTAMIHAAKSQAVNE
ncbi:uncharacterized protein LOC134845647 [Symsagittifera roscoffensis]|uniref:uncharacterized protein LOC134845647 n=1 Tax=Symsagittifera roscoffensis TaxID=84072 RepID=UPI00307C0A9A